jgi:fructose-1-phosphate kinase PfkB-like protein
VTAAEWAALLAATTAAAGPGWTVVSGSLPAGAPPDGAAQLVAAARAGGGRVCVDTSGPALAAALTAGPDLVKVNATEAAELLRLPADTAPAELACRLHERAGGAGTAVVTAGVHGAAAWTTTPGQPAGCPVTVRPPAERGPYPVGSGDAFLAGLIVALDGGADLHRALHAATAAAAANAAVPGAGELPADLTAPG